MAKSARGMTDALGDVDRAVTRLKIDDRAIEPEYAIASQPQREQEQQRHAERQVADRGEHAVGPLAPGPCRGERKQAQQAIDDATRQIAGARKGFEAANGIHVLHPSI